MQLNPFEIARTIVNALEEKKGENILLIDIHEIASFADYFVICTGTSDRMLDSLSKEVNENVNKSFDLKASIEGLPRDGWLVMDYRDVVVHLFSPDQREYYHLEQLWEKGKTLLKLI
jgi:ribosome-associated protein